MKVIMSRDDVDNNPHQTCSRGLHVAGHGYMSQYSGNVIVAVKVNPKNVISIPYDYDSQKIRTCEYEVLAVVDQGSEIEDAYFPWDKRHEASSKENSSNEVSLIDITKLSATRIIDYVKSVTGKLIPVSPKSKQSVVTHALRMLAEKGVYVSGNMFDVDRDYIPQDEYPTDIEEVEDAVGFDEDPDYDEEDEDEEEMQDVVYLHDLYDMTAKDVVDYVKKLTREKITISLKSKSSIINKAVKIFEARGYNVV
jgi:hypothetical protein